MVSTVGQTVLHRNERGTTRLELKIAAGNRVHNSVSTSICADKSRRKSMRIPRTGVTPVLLLHRLKLCGYHKFGILRAELHAVPNLAT